MHTEAVLTIFVLAAVASAQNFSVNTPVSPSMMKGYNTD